MNETAGIPAPGMPYEAPSKGRWVSTGIVVILIVLIVGGGWWYYASRPSNVTQLGPGTTFTQAASGALAAGFPPDLILEKDAPLTPSYSISYQEGALQQPVAGYVSGKSVRDNILAFRTYLVQNDWNLLRPGNATDQPAFIFAVKGNAQVSVMFQAQPGGKTNVSIAYLVKE